MTIRIISKTYLLNLLKMTLRRIFYLSLYYFREFLLSRVFQIIIFFFVFSFLTSSLVGILAVSEEKKVLLDFFLAATYLTSILFSIVYPPLSINNEIETKRIYLVISKSTSRYECFFSKFFAFVVTSFALVLISTSVFFIFLSIFKGYHLPSSYFKEIAFIVLKTIVIISISMGFSFITSSFYSTILITTMIWIASHFTLELKYSLNNIKSAIDYFGYISYLLPDFSYQKLDMNIFLHYMVYSSAWLYLAATIFDKKEL